MSKTAISTTGGTICHRLTDAGWAWEETGSRQTLLGGVVGGGDLDGAAVVGDVQLAAVGGAIVGQVGDQGLQGPVEEEVVVLGAPDARPPQVVELGVHVDVDTVLEVELLEQCREAAERRRLAAAESARKRGKIVRKRCRKYERRKGNKKF